jgi:hypothetical protein
MSRSVEQRPIAKPPRLRIHGVSPDPAFRIETSRREVRHLLLTGGLGLLLLLALFYYSGVDKIAKSVVAIGWGLGVVILLRFAKVAGGARAWSYLFPMAARIYPSILFGLRLVREGINTLLPSPKSAANSSGRASRRTTA